MIETNKGPVPAFTYDVFISYAHIDNQPAPGSTGWVNSFYAHLTQEVWRINGRKDIRFYFDSSLHGNDEFDPVLEKAINESATFISLNSVGYKRSTYCAKELSKFVSKASAEKIGLQLRNKRRLFHTLIANIPITDWQQEFQGMRSYCFYTATDETDIGRPIETGNEYGSRIHDLAADICRLLVDMNGEVSQSSVVNKDIVFIAGVSGELGGIKQRVVTELKAKGIDVISDVPPPYEPETHEEKVIESIRKSCLAVHLFDASPAIDAEAGISYPQKQMELSLHEKTAKLILISSNLKMESISDSNYREFLSKLENGTERETQYEFARNSYAYFSKGIMESLDALKKKPAPTGPFEIMIDTHKKDENYAWRLGEYLVKNRVQPYITPEEDDPENFLNEFGGRLAKVKRLIIVFGAVSEDWVVNRILYAIRTSAEKRRPLDKCWVYLAPPKKEKPVLDFLSLSGVVRINMIDHSSEFDQETLSPLMQA